MAYIADVNYHAMAKQINDWYQAGMIDQACAVALLQVLGDSHMGRI